MYLLDIYLFIYLFNTLLHQQEQLQKNKNNDTEKHWCKGGLITAGDLFQATPTVKRS